MADVIDFNDAAPQKERPRREGTERVEALKAALERQSKSFVGWLFPAATFARGQAFVGSIHGEPGESLVIETDGRKTGLWKDFADGTGGNDFISLYQAVQRVNFPKALEDLESWLGFGPKPQSFRQHTQKPKEQKEQLGAPTAQWHYKDVDGQIVTTVYRYDHTDKRGRPAKTYRPWNVATRKHEFPETRIIYNLPGIIDAQTVIFAEGEKAADALIADGIPATAVMGGSKTALDKCDLSPLVGKDIIIWPDNDTPGLEFAGNLANRLSVIGVASVRVIPVPPGKPEGWDAADATAADRQNIIGQASNTEKTSSLPLIWASSITPGTDSHDFVEGVLCDGQMSVVYGESNCGKTFFIADLALHVALGKPWRGRDVEQGGVIYAALEGAAGISNRIYAYLLKNDLLAKENIPFAVIPSSINLLNPEADTVHLIESIKQAEKEINGPVRMIVIDTLARALAGGNENSSEDMGALVINSDRVRYETGAHICFIHHSGKDQARGARGHSSLRAATDTEIEIIRDTDLEISTATVTKQRELEIDGEFGFKLNPIQIGTNKRDKPLTSCTVEETDQTAKREAKLTPTEAQAYKDIFSLFASDTYTKHVVPQPGMPNVRAINREDIKTHLVRTCFIENKADATSRTRFFRAINGLKDKGKIGVYDDWVWLLD